MTSATAPPRSDRAAAAWSIPPAPPRADYPLSFAQERLWLLQRLEPQSVAYNAAAALQLRGPLDLRAFGRALTRIVERHAVLRTTFDDIDGQPVQRVRPTVPAVVAVRDGRDGTLDPDAFVREELQRVFDLATGPLFRAHLLRIAPDEHRFVLVLHHIIGDAWSCGVFFEELAAGYGAEIDGREAAVAPLPIQYADYAVWQRERMQGTRRQAELAFWRRELDAAPHVLELPRDYPRPQAAAASGARRPVTIGERTFGRVVNLARTHGTTPFVVLLAAFELLLSRYAGVEDVLVGTPVANRMFPEVQGLIGYLSNTLVLRARPRDTDTVDAFLREQHRACMGALGHQELPFEQLVTELRVARESARQPLAQTAFAWEYAQPAPLVFPGLDARRVDVDGGMTSFDLAMVLQPPDASVHGWIKYRTDLFQAETIDAMAEAYAGVVDQMTADSRMRLGDVALVTSSKDRVAVEPFGAGRDQLLPARIEHWAAAQPGATAVRDARRPLSWMDLNARANRLAHRLIRLGARPDDVVAVCVDDPLERIVAVAGVLKAGAAYLPLDAALPPGRLAWMLEDARPRVAVTVSHLAAPLSWLGERCVCLDRDAAAIEAESGAAPNVSVLPGHLAYVMYTSGSTGRPKGVLIPHAGVAHIAECQREAFAPAPGDRVLQFASFSFDASVFEMVLALAHGATLEVADREALLPGSPLQDTLTGRRITHTLLPPSALATLHPDPALALKCLFVGGEACPDALAREWAWRCTMFNLYGPTEVTIYGTESPLTPPVERVTIGRAIAHAQAHVVDERCRLVPVGVPGEILLGGAGLARGYQNRPDLTAERFMPDPFSPLPGARLYRTGDVGKLRREGDIEYVGRNDQQIKLRGYRIELAEIQSLLLMVPGVAECVVAARPGPGGAPELVAYVRQEGVAVDAGQLRDALRQDLPEYMVPAALLVLEAFPRTPSAKPDRAALAALAIATDDARSPRPAETDMERLVGDVWRELFDGRAVGRDTNFFDVGGNSLLLLRVQASLETRLGRRIPIVELFRHATIATLAGRLEHLTEPVRSGADDVRTERQRHGLRRQRELRQARIPSPSNVR